MTDFEFPKRPKKTISDLNVVPILDMFVSIVFFLILSASMVGMTKIVLPPSSTSSIESGSTKIPINAKLMVLSDSHTENSIKVVLKWGGQKPGTDSINFKEDVFKNSHKIVDDIKAMTKKFKDQYPEEKTIQIGMQSAIPYQWLISAMDGVREILPDMVLISYQLADTITEK